MMNKLLTVALLLCIGMTASANPVWTLRKNTEGIKVYTSSIEGSNVKAIKVECTIRATTDQLVALLLDAKAHEQWVYSTKRSYALKNLSEGHQIYYSEVSMPWPLSNREVVVDIKITKQSATGILFIKATAIDGYVPVSDNKVRVRFSDVSWTVTPIDDGLLRIEYVAQADPGGSVPAWISNLFLTKGPLETFKLLRKVVQQPAYKDAAVTLSTQ